MRFITRSLMGLMLMTLTLALLGAGGQQHVISAYKNEVQ